MRATHVGRRNGGDADTDANDEVSDDKVELPRRQELYSRAQREQCTRNQDGALASDRITASNERSHERVQSHPAGY